MSNPALERSEVRADYHRLLLAWFDSHKRDLPWRKTKDPYAIWVSEIMLQQTQVATVIPYFERWLAAFPTAQALATADEQQVLALWQGLGYYRRAKLLHAGAKQVAENGIPSDAAGWRDVPGVGRYTAGAISSIALNLSEPLVDGNVERVYSRLTADSSPAKELTAAAWKWAEKLVPAQRPGDWNQALMELGATVCKPDRADCDRCPLVSKCVAHARGEQTRFPTPKPKTQTVKLQHEYWVVRRWENGIPLYAIEQIGSETYRSGSPEEKGRWWEGMWQFLRVGPEGAPPGLVDYKDDLWPVSLGSFTHAVTYHRITVSASLVDLPEKAPQLSETAFRWVSMDEIDKFALPAPQSKIITLAKRDSR